MLVYKRVMIMQFYGRNQRSLEHPLLSRHLFYPAKNALQQLSQTNQQNNIMMWMMWIQQNNTIFQKYMYIMWGLLVISWFITRSNYSSKYHKP